MSCPPGKIRNDNTGRCVNIDGAIGRKLLKERLVNDSVVDGKIMNLSTGRYVNVNGAIGKRLLKEQEKSKSSSKTTAASRTTTKRKLLICHGSTHKKIPGWTDADTIDDFPDNKPTYLANILKKKELSIIKHKYDEIMTVYCPYNVYIIASGHIGIGKVDMKPNRRFFVNVSNLLKPGGLLKINNLSLYLNNVKNKGMLSSSKLAQVFAGEISDLFEYVLLSTKEQMTLTLRKK